MKVFTLIVIVLLIGTSSAVKIRQVEKRTALEDTKTNETEDAARVEITTSAATDKKEKEVHKRGILHHGGAFASSGSLWPKTYASHYGYGLHLPAASSFAPAAWHSPSVLKYNSGFHYKSLAGPAVLSGVAGLGSVSGFSAALPTYASLNPAVSHVHPAAAVQPFIIRPGGAVVQSYSVTYPHRKTAVAVKPVQSFASVSPVSHLHPVQPVAAVQPAIQPIHTFQTVQHIQPVQPVQPVAAVQPVQPVAAVQPVHHLQPVQPVQHLHPVQPVQTVVQVQHFKPPVQYDVTQQFPSFFQTSFIPPAPVPAVPQAPTVSFNPAPPNFPAFPNPPAFPETLVPDVPAVPAIPNIPTIPSIPNFPQPQVPSSGFFPVNVQPPLNQKPPAFDNVPPQNQFPSFRPVTSHHPERGNADAAPQIPVQPLPSPQPELPSPQPEPTQQPWRPVLYEPPTAESPLGRPSNTLLPPYGNTPAEGYLPPAPSSHGARIQQEYTIDNSLFDNLSDADIQQIFAQANLAAQRDHNHHHHHTVHNYHTRY